MCLREFVCVHICVSFYIYIYVSGKVVLLNMMCVWSCSPPGALFSPSPPIFPISLLKKDTRSELQRRMCWMGLGSHRSELGMRGLGSVTVEEDVMA